MRRRSEAPRERFLRGFAVLLLLAAVPAREALAAQTVTGQVVDTVSHTAVGEGFVVLLNEHGREVVRTLSGADGRFTLRAPAAGSYRLRSERIGYAATTTGWVPLSAGETVRLALPVRALGVRLEALVVARESKCRERPDRAGDDATSTVWEQVRQALAAAAWTAGQRTYQYRAVTYEREWDVDRRDVAAEAVDTVVGFTLAAFEPRSAALLAEEGYVVAEEDGASYYAPDAAVLQDSAFLESHCFNLVRRPGQVGLAFAPVPGRRQSDVRGALWLDAASAELRTLEFRYTGLAEGVNDERAGGTLDFLRLPTGAWIVRRWQIRMPRIAVRVLSGISAGRREVELRGWRDQGGEVLEIRAAERGGVLLYPAARGPDE